MKLRIAVAATLCLLLAWPLAKPAHAQNALERSASPRAVLARLLSSPHISQDWLAPDFSEQIPAFKLERYVAQYKAELGAFDRVLRTGRNGEYLAVFAKGTLPALIALDERGRVSELLFRVPQPYSLSRALRTLRALSGSAAYSLWKDGREVWHAGQSAGLEAPSGSVLSALVALVGRIDSGRAHWDDVVRLQPGWKVTPAQVIADWPAGAPLTLQTLATLAVADRDRTAARALAALTGSTAPQTFTNRQLCGFMRRLESLPLMSVNTGIAPVSQWTHVAYAGASNPNAIAMTTWLVKGPNTYCVSATWNPSPGPVDTTTFSNDYFILLNSLDQP